MRARGPARRRRRCDRTGNSMNSDKNADAAAPVTGLEHLLDERREADAKAAGVAGVDMPAVIDGVALARLYGEPLFTLPQDLYIPPDALEVFLEAFEGPLDLLLYLIRRQHFNVLDIPMAPLTQQYLHYIEQIRTHNLELAAEYLLMAALLIEIKSRMLLPRAQGRHRRGGRGSARRTGAPAGRVRAYQARGGAARWAAAHRARFPARRGRHRADGDGAPSRRAIADLQAAWNDILRRSKLHTHHRVARTELSVREHMSLILRHLQGRAVCRVRGPVRSRPGHARGGRAFPGAA